MDTHCYVTSATITIATSSSDYTLDTAVLEIIEMFPTSGTVTYAMERVSILELLEMRRFAPSSAGPTLYYALQGQNLMLFHPAPAVNDTFTMYYVPVPTTLASALDDPSSAAYGGIPTPFHKAIEYFALSEAADANDDSSSQEGAKYFTLYQDQIKKLRRVLKRRGGTRAARAIVGPRNPRRRSLVNHENSVY